jgi:predicted DNA-binding transcriptional regulator YafY
MSQSQNQRIKLLYLLKILSEETDDAHGLTVKDLNAKLSVYDISVDRKTMYSDFENLRLFGVDIIAEQIGRETYYHIGSRKFELPELKLLVDSVQSAKFLSARKSSDLIKKIESLGSKYDAKHLQRQVFISDRIKTMNESIYYNVDTLHEAISANKQVRFHYYQWTVNKEMKLRKDGAWYAVSPWGLMWDDENYYLVAFDEKEQKIKHYRVDKMVGLQTLDEERVGSKEYKEFNLPKYTKSLFGMYGGEPTKVTLEGQNDYVGVVIDRFGKDIPITKKDNEHFTVQVNVAVSRQFFGWVFAIGEGLKIIAPEGVVQQMREEVTRLQQIYS